MNDEPQKTLGSADIGKVLQALPHRYPFLMVDRVEKIDGDRSAVGIKAVTANEPQFQGHFPGRPVMPGVLLIEGMAQTAGVICVLASANTEPRSVYFMTIDKCKFRRPVVPGDVVEFHMTKKAQRKTMWWYHGEARVGNELVAEADVGAMLKLVNQMAKIDPTARVEDGARLAADVVVGPFCIVSAGAELAAGVELVSHVSIMGATRIGANTKVYPFAVLGGPPQALRHKSGPTRVEIGADCTVREGVTINGGADFSTGLTVVGDRCFMMTGAHVGHDCRVGNDVTFANCATLGGHAVIGDKVFLGGLCAVHQFTRVGELAIIGGMCAVVHDLIPFGAVVGARARLGGLNMIGLKRNGYSRPAIHALRHAYRMLFFSEGTVMEGAERVAEAFPGDPHVGKLVEFVRTSSKRQLTVPRDARED